MRLCEHPDAGDFVLLGWREGIIPITFAEENGALLPGQNVGFLGIGSGLNCLMLGVRW